MTYYRPVCQPARADCVGNPSALANAFGMPPKPDVKLAAVIRAGDRLDEAERKLEAARQVFYGSLKEAVASGVSISAIARARGVSRQAIQKLVARGR